MTVMLTCEHCGASPSYGSTSYVRKCPDADSEYGCVWDEEFDDETYNCQRCAAGETSSDEEEED